MIRLIYLLLLCFLNPISYAAQNPLVNISTQNQQLLQSLVPILSDSCDEHFSEIDKHYLDIQQLTSLLNAIELKRFAFQKNRIINSYCENDDTHNLCSSKTSKKNKVSYTLDLNTIRQKISSIQEKHSTEQYQISLFLKTFFNSRATTQDSNLEYPEYDLESESLKTLYVSTFPKINDGYDEFTILPTEIKRIAGNTDYNNLKIGELYPFRNLQIPDQFSNILDFDIFEPILLKFSYITSSHLSKTSNSIDQNQNYFKVKTRFISYHDRNIQRVLFINRENNQTVYIGRNGRGWKVFTAEIQSVEAYKLPLNSFYTCDLIIENELKYRNQWADNPNKIMTNLSTVLEEMF